MKLKEEIPRVSGYYWAHLSLLDEDPIIVHLYTFLGDVEPDTIFFYGTDNSMDLQEWGKDKFWSERIIVQSREKQLEEIIRKYANHVADNEGTDFLSAAHLFEGEARLSKEEIKELREITGWDEGGKNFSFNISKRA